LYYSEDWTTHTSWFGFNSSTGSFAFLTNQRLYEAWLPHNVAKDKSGLSLASRFYMQFHEILNKNRPAQRRGHLIMDWLVAETENDIERYMAEVLKN
jgi:hypothetical protein